MKALKCVKKYMRLKTSDRTRAFPADLSAARAQASGTAIEPESLI